MKFWSLVTASVQVAGQALRAASTQHAGYGSYGGHKQHTPPHGADVSRTSSSGTTGGWRQGQDSALLSPTAQQNGAPARSPSGGSSVLLWPGMTPPQRPAAAESSPSARPNGGQQLPMGGLGAGVERVRPPALQPTQDRAAGWAGTRQGGGAGAVTEWSNGGGGLIRPAAAIDGGGQGAIDWADGRQTLLREQYRR